MGFVDRLRLFGTESISIDVITKALDLTSALSSFSNSDIYPLTQFTSDAIFALPAEELLLLTDALAFNGVVVTEVDGITEVTFESSNLKIVEGESSVHINGGSGHDTISGTQVGDEILAGSGNDIVDGGLGDDILHGQSGNDQLQGGEGNDTLTVDGSGSNTLDGGAGDDILKVNRMVTNNSTSGYYQRDHSSVANNTFKGGLGDDRLEGTVGADTYVFGLGDGHDTINDSDNKVYYSGSYNKTDRIALGEGITKDALTIRRDGNHLILVIGGGDSGDSITIEHAYTNSRYRIEEIVLADETVIAGSEIFELPVYATVGDDVIQGSGFSENITTEAGNDTVNAGGGNDIVDGGLGDDILHGQSGNDQLQGGEGNDTLTVDGSGSNTLDGGAGDDILKVNRMVTNNSTSGYYQRDHSSVASNTFKGGLGDDRLEGTVGADTYVFGLGDGHDTINDSDNKVYYSGSYNKTDRIALGEGITKDALTIRRDGNHLILVIGGGDSGDSITIEHAYTNSRYRIEEIVLADGTVIADSKIFELPMLGTDGDDTIQGTGFSETIFAGAGDDVINGGAGNDRYQFSRGDGHDTINNFSSIADETDQLIFGEGIEKEDIWLTRNDNDLVIDLSGSDDQITVDDWFVNEAHQVDNIVAGDDILASSQVSSLISAMAGFENPASGNTDISQEIKDQIYPTIVASWQQTS